MKNGSIPKPKKYQDVGIKINLPCVPRVCVSLFLAKLVGCICSQWHYPIFQGGRQFLLELKTPGEIGVAGPDIFDPVKQESQEFNMAVHLPIMDNSSVLCIWAAKYLS